jgi:hypothetical protein
MHDIVNMRDMVDFVYHAMAATNHHAMRRSSLALVASAPTDRWARDIGLLLFRDAGCADMLADDVIELRLSELNDAEIRLGVKHGGLDEQVDERLVAMLEAELPERGEFSQVRLSLHAHDYLELAGTAAGGGKELEEEVVSVTALADERSREPALELIAASAREAIDVLVRAVALRYHCPPHQPIANEALEYLVQVSNVQLSPLRPNRLLKLCPQFVSVAWSFSEECQHRMLDRQPFPPLRSLRPYIETMYAPSQGLPYVCPRS